MFGKHLWFVKWWGRKNEQRESKGKKGWGGVWENAPMTASCTNPSSWGDVKKSGKDTGFGAKPGLKSQVYHIFVEWSQVTNMGLLAPSLHGNCED